MSIKTNSEVFKAIAYMAEHPRTGVHTVPSAIVAGSGAKLTSETLARRLRQHSKTRYLGVSKQYYISPKGLRIAIYGVIK